MNPFSHIGVFDPKNKLFDGGRLITVGATAGQGKSLCINTLILNYIDKGVDVLLFTENTRNSYAGMQQTIEDMTFEKSRKFDAGILYMCPVVFENPVEYFINQLNAFIPFHNHYLGSFAIVIDGDMFTAENRSFDFLTIGPNTRVVLTEKINKNIKPNVYRFEISKDYDKPSKVRVKNLAFLNLAQKYNAHIIFSTQLINNDSPLTRVYGNTPFIVDMYIRAKRDMNKFNNFAIDFIKNRFGNEKTYICEMDQTNLTLVEKAKKDIIEV